MTTHSVNRMRWLLIVFGTAIVSIFSMNRRSMSEYKRLVMKGPTLYRKTGAASALPNLSTVILSRETLMAQENGSCPELLAASRFATTAFAQTLPEIKIGMVQLVGHWEIDQQSNIMRQVFQNNQKICARHNIPAHSITGPINTTDSRKPAFWKVQAVKRTCATGRYDVVWFLDGDVLIKEQSIPIQALWIYHSHTRKSANATTSEDQLDFLFSMDWNGMNSGNFLINCLSPSALKYLDEWDRSSQYYDIYYPVWYEQNFLHYSLNTSHFWSNIRLYNRRQPPPNHTWDDHGAQVLRDNPSLWSSQALRHRLRTTDTQCAFTRYPSEVLSRRKLQKYVAEYGYYQKGVDVSVHAASLKDQFPYLTRQLHESSLFEGSRRNYTRVEAALGYLETHDLRVLVHSPNETKSSVN